jgi:hypothetical protein
MTICLIRRAHFLDIFDVREMPLLASHSLIHATKRNVFGGFKKSVNFLVGSVLVFLMIQTGIYMSQKQSVLKCLDSWRGGSRTPPPLPLLMVRPRPRRRRMNRPSHPTPFVIARLQHIRAFGFLFLH